MYKLLKVLLFAATAALAFGQAIVPPNTFLISAVSPVSSGGAATFSSITDTGLTAGRVVIVSTGGLLADDAGFLYNATTDALTSGLYVSGVGSAAAPSYTFTGRTTDGFYSDSGASIAASLGGAVSLYFRSSGVLGTAGGATFQGNASGGVVVTAAGTNQSITLTPSGTGSVILPAGTQAAPGLTITGTATTGFYQASTTEWQFVTANTERVGFNSQGLKIGLVGSASAPTIFINGDPNTGVFWPGPDRFAFVTAGTQRGEFSLAGNLLLGGLTTDGTTHGKLQFPTGAADATSGITFDSGTTDLYASATGVVRLANASADTAQFVLQGNGGASVVFQSVGAAGTINAARSGGTLAFQTNSGTTVLTMSATAGTFTGGAQSMTLVSGTGNSRTMTLQTTTSGGTATTFLVADITQGVTLASLAGTGSRAVLADANGLLSAPVSDELWKEPLRPLPESYGIETVMRLRPSLFKYKDHSRFGSQDYIGFGARATAAVLPEVTGQDRDGTYYLTDEKLTAVLVKAVQQQQAQIDELRAELAKMRN